MESWIAKPEVIRGSWLHTCQAPALDESVDIVTQIMRLRACVGDGLNDLELTEFLKLHVPTSPDGFSVLCFSQGAVTFAVPRQDLSGWYGENCTIAPQKESLAAAIADQHRLTLCEPPDKLTYGSPGPGSHRHLELANRWRTIAAAHPFYLKLRVCAGGEHEDVPVDSEAAVRQCAALLRDLAALYR